MIKECIGTTVIAIALTAGMVGNASASVAGDDRPEPGAGTTRPDSPGSTRDLKNVCNQYESGAGDLCLYWGDPATSSRIAFYRSDTDLSDDHFKTAGSGQNEVVADNTTWVRNFDRTYTFLVCTGTSFTGECAAVAPGASGNLTRPFYLRVNSVRLVPPAIRIG